MTPAGLPVTVRPVWALLLFCLIAYGALCAVSVIWLSDWGQNGPGFAAGYAAAQRQALGVALACGAGLWWLRDRLLYALLRCVGIDSIGLPTELEWEFNARGGRHTQTYLWADDASKAETCRHAQTVNCPGDVLPVSGRLKNGYGLDHMIGNVWEWTATDWRDDRKSMGASPRDHGNDSTGLSAARAVRGASVNFNGSALRLAFRFRDSPGDRSYNIGFHLVARIAPRKWRVTPGPLTPLPPANAAAAT